MSPRFTPPLLLTLILAATTFVAFYIGAQRHRMEASNRAVHVVADLADVRLVAAGEGLPAGEVLRRLKEAGLTGVAIAEDTFDELFLSARIVPLPGIPPRYAVQDEQLYERIADAIEYRFGPPQSPETAPLILSPTREALPLPARLSDIRLYGIGLDPATTRFVSELGLSPIARIGNMPATTPDAIIHVLGSAQAVGAEGVIFSGDQVLGRRELVPFAAEQMRRLGVWFGFIEFTVQGGASRMLSEMADETLRVHSMNPIEIDRTDVPEIVDRYVRAAAERNIKVLYLRPVSLSTEEPLRSFERVVSGVSRGLQAKGFAAKAARPMEDPERPLPFAVLLGFGVSALTFWLCSRVINSRLWLGLIAVVLLLLVAGVYTGATTKYMALLAALAFPTWAMLAAFAADNSGGGRTKWILAFFWVTAISVIGGLHVAGLLTELRFMIRLDQFFGVKLAHFLPPVAVAGHLLHEQLNIRRMMDERVRWFDIMLLGVVAVAVLFMLMRTGNEAVTDVSSIELRIRTLLDRLLPERPRTKEFLVGHPALALAAAMAWLGNRRYLPLVGFLAAIGQASVVNTFAHLHTPIMVSAVRVATGVVVGGMIGVAVILVYQRLRREETQSTT